MDCKRLPTPLAGHEIAHAQQPIVRFNWYLGPDPSALEDTADHTPLGIERKFLLKIDLLQRFELYPNCKGLIHFHTFQAVDNFEATEGVHLGFTDLGGWVQIGDVNLFYWRGADRDLAELHNFLVDQQGFLDGDGGYFEVGDFCGCIWEILLLEVYGYQPDIILPII